MTRNIMEKIKIGTEGKIHKKIERNKSENRFCRASRAVLI